MWNPFRKKKLRFTGENPPVELWTQYPNWTNAWDEEGAAGQDETTLRPDHEQNVIGSDTTFTAADVTFADGRTFPAFAEIGNAELWGFHVYETDAEWYYRHDSPTNRWGLYAPAGISTKDRPSVSYNESAVFPLRLKLRLPWSAAERLPVYEFPGNGSCHRISKSA